MAPRIQYTTDPTQPYTFHQARFRIANTAYAEKTHGQLIAVLRYLHVPITKKELLMSRRQLSMRLAWALLPAVTLVQLELPT